MVRLIRSTVTASLVIVAISAGALGLKSVRVVAQQISCNDQLPGTVLDSKLTQTVTPVIRCLASEIAALQGQNASLQRQLASLQFTNGDLLKAVTEAQKAIADLKSDLGAQSPFVLAAFYQMIESRIYDAKPQFYYRTTDSLLIPAHTETTGDGRKDATPKCDGNDVALAAGIDSDNSGNDAKLSLFLRTGQNHPRAVPATSFVTASGWDVVAWNEGSAAGNLRFWVSCVHR